VARPNRVTPLGDLVADPARGLVFGNRGCLHDDAGRIRRRYAGRRWIACRLEFKGRRRAPLQPGRYTELFFLDDATALAAGHRPCAECRRADYEAFAAAWRRLHPRDTGADALDRRLHEERLGARPLIAFADVPDGAFVLHEGAPHLVLGGRLLRWTPAGYGAPAPSPRGGSAELVTPASTAAVLAAGWRPAAVPFLHRSAG
jgi:hypothetical protein